MNFIPATIGSDGATVVASGFTLPVPEKFRTATAQLGGQKVVLGIRPENIREAPREASDRIVAITVKVEFVEPLGHEVIVHGRVGTDLLVAKVEPHRAPKMGEEVRLVIEVDACHLFDPTTEKRLGN